MRAPRKKSRRRRRRLLRLVVAVVCLALLLVLGVTAARRVFVLPYRALLEREAARFALSPSLVAGLVLAESGFDAAALSPAGAVGLMQLTPDTYQWLCHKQGVSPEAGELTDPACNLRFGCYNLSLLLGQFPDLPTALAAYNAGPARVRSWLRDPALSRDGEKLDSIPYPETETHGQRVLLYRLAYRVLYGLD
ncbi:MAG: lytic transglycosylase domain-containing protein [Clostridia bacterium]|nr:lytic transglycosylase domain-containing protein [Clostridia bacterium]